MKPILDLSKNNDYRSWVKELKQRYLSARLKASIEANRTLLEYYWSLGRDIADKQYANTYGSGFYKTLSHDLRSEMPEEKGFSWGRRCACAAPRTGSGRPDRGA